jgi:hypothetical protein
MSRMTSYDPRAVSDQFFEAAQRAYQALDKIREQMKSKPQLSQAHDEQLASFYVLNYLYRRPSLDSQATLHNELQWLKQNPPPESINACDRDYFERCRQHCIDDLIANGIPPSRS